MKNYKDIRFLNVLYADDDIELNSSMAKTLKLIVDNVFSAFNGKEALEIFNSNRIDVVLLDIRMGDVSGIEVAQEIRKVNKQVPIVIISSYAETDDLLAACKLNLIEYICKPIELSKLIEVLSLSLDSLKDNGLMTRKINEEVSYNYLSKQLIKNSDVINLTKNEIAALELLLAEKGKMVPYDRFFAIMDEEMSDGALKNLILRLRKKIGDEKNIRNLSKIGYTLL